MNNRFMGMNLWRTTGPDSIPTRLLSTHLHDRLVLFLTQFYRNCVTSAFDPYIVALNLCKVSFLNNIHFMLLQWYHTNKVGWSHRSLLLKNRSFCGIMSSSSVFWSDCGILYMCAITNFCFCRFITFKCTCH